MHWPEVLVVAEPEAALLLRCLVEAEEPERVEAARAAWVQL